MTKPKWAPDAQAALERIKGKLFATVPEASVILGYDRVGRTVRAAIEAGAVPAIRVGETYRIPTSWIIEQTQVGAGTARGKGGASDAA
jgi:excisionase family DNA binding protein